MKVNPEVSNSQVSPYLCHSILPWFSRQIASLERHLLVKLLRRFIDSVQAEDSPRASELVDSALYIIEEGGYE